jgi:hypothetical protein
MRTGGFPHGLIDGKLEHSRHGIDWLPNLSSAAHEEWQHKLRDIQLRFANQAPKRG